MSFTFERKCNWHPLYDWKWLIEVLINHGLNLPERIAKFCDEMGGG